MLNEILSDLKYFVPISNLTIFALDFNSINELYI